MLLFLITSECAYVPRDSRTDLPTDMYSARGTHQPLPFDGSSSLLIAPSSRDSRSTLHLFSSCGLSCEADGITVGAVPFPHAHVDRLTADDNFLSALQTELSTLTYVEKANDLYRFRQTEELAGCDAPAVAALQ